MAVSPFEPTVLDKLNEAGIDTYAVGKINDIFNGAGINHDMGHNKSNSHGIDNLIKAMTSEDFKHGFSFTNLVDFDALYGHRVIHMDTVIACTNLTNVCLKSLLLCVKMIS